MSTLWGPRVYSPIAARQQRADRVVSTERDLRNVFAEASRGIVATMRLGANIFLEAPLVLSGGGYDCLVDGGGRFRIGAGNGFAGTELLATEGTVSGLVFRDVAFAAPEDTTLERMMFLDGTALGFSFDRVTFVRIKRVHQSTTTHLWLDSTFSDLSLEGLELSDLTEIGAAQYKRCAFTRCYASLPSLTTRVLDVGDMPGSTNLLAHEAVLSNSTDSPQILAFDTSQLYALRLTSGLYLEGDTRSTGNGATHWTTQGTSATSGATSTTIVSFTPEPSRCLLVEARVCARRTNNADEGACFFIQQRYKVNAAGTVTAAAALQNVSAADLAWAAGIDTSGGAIRVRGTGGVGHNVAWSAFVTVDEI